MSKLTKMAFYVKPWKSLAVSCPGFLFSVAVVFGVPPANDHFESAAPIEAGSLLRQEITFATVQPDEPQHWTNSAWQGNLKTLWWSYTAAEPGEFVIDSSASSTASKVLAVYTGTRLDDLHPVSYTFGDNLLAFPTIPGVQYFIAAALDHDSAAQIILSAEFFAPPPNDHFVNRIRLRGNHHVLEVSTFGATAERGEPGSIPSIPGAGILKSVWFEWVPERSGLVERLQYETGIFPSDVGLSFSIWQGTELTALESLDINAGLLAGETYQVQVYSRGLPRREIVPLRANSTQAVFEPGTADYATIFRLLPDPERTDLAKLHLRGWNEVSFTQTNEPWSISITSSFSKLIQYSPELTYRDGYGIDLPLVSTYLSKVHDEFATAPMIPGGGGDIPSPAFAGSTWETGEPEHFTETEVTEGTLWWRWVPSFTGSALVWLRDAHCRMYHGAAFDELIPVATHPEIPFLYEVVAGGEYHIVAQADARSSLNPETLVVKPFEPPANDSHLAAIELVPNGPVTFSTLGATADPAEPGTNHPPYTVWWKISIPEPGHLHFSFKSWAPNQPAIAFFKGAEMEPLISISGYPIVAPGSFYIRASSEFHDPREHTLQLSFVPASGNDDFADRIRLEGLPAEAKGVNANATVEPFEQMPDSDPDLTSLWWEWISPLTGEVVATLPNTGTLRIFQGNQLGNLQEIPVERVGRGSVDQQERTTFRALEGAAYVFQVSSTHASEPQLWLDYEQGPNDSFSQAHPLSFPPRQIYIDLASATREEGEPEVILEPREEYSDWVLTGSLWFTWTAPVEGIFSISDYSSYIVRAYSGTELETLEGLRPVMPASYSYHLRQGVKYHFAVMNLRPATSEPSSWLPLLYDFTGLTLTAPAPNAVVAPGFVPFQVSPAYDPNVAAVSLFLWGSWDTQGKPPIFTGKFDLPASTNLWLSPGDYQVGVMADGIAYRETRFSVAQTNDLFTSRVRVTNGFSRAYPLHSSRLAPGEASLFPAGVTGSTWFEFSSPANVTAVVHSRVPLAVFRGTNLNSLIPIVVGVTNITWNAEANATYSVAMLYTGTFPLTPVVEEISFGHSPLNDAFTNAHPLELVDGVRTIIDGALHLGTLEPGEPLNWNDSSSAWWSWTAPGDGTFMLEGAGQLFQGEAVDRLTEIPVYSNGATKKYLVASGETYSIRIANGLSGLPGLPVEFASTTATFTASGRNDDFADRVFLAGRSVRIQGANGAATREWEEPALYERSVWWSWMAPSDGLLHATFLPDSRAQDLALYTGEALAMLQRVSPVSSALREFVFPVQGGTTYQLQVASPLLTVSGVFDLQLEFADGVPPENDDFVNRTFLHGESVAAEGSTASATLESGEIFAGTFNGSVWWTWVPPTSGIARFYSKGSAGLYLFTGGEWPSLHFRKVVALYGSQIWVGQGEPVHIAGASLSPASVSFEIELLEGVPNVTPATALHLEEELDFFTDFPKGELDFEGPHTPGPALLWWAWTAPSAGYLRIDAGEEITRSVISIHDGANYFGPFYDPEGAPFPVFVSRAEWPVPVIAGRTYNIAVTGRIPGWLQLYFEPQEWNPTITTAADGTPTLHLAPPGPGIVSVETSDDLQTWRSFQLLRATKEPLQIIDPIPAASHKFYRVRPLQ